MPISQQRTNWTLGFKGLQQSMPPGASAVYSPDCSNVKFKHGRIIGRGGMAKYKSISTAMTTTPIIGLFNYRKSSGTHELLRMSPSNVEKESAGSWSDVTPATTLTGVSTTTRPQYDIIDDILVFTNEGEDTPKKYDGSGDFEDIGGSPPYCKSICAYYGYLFLLNVSTAGTFTDIEDGYRTAYFADDWDTDWTPCLANTLLFDETPGAVVAAATLGRFMYVFKTDGVIKVTWTGGQLQFRQDKLDCDVGCLAPLSVKRVGEIGLIFLGTDGLIYLIREGGVPEPISYGFITSLLSDLLNSDKLQYARAETDSEDDTYYLLLNISSLSGQAHDAYVSYNFRTKEWSKGLLEQDVYAICVFKATEYVAEDILMSTSTLVETFNGTAIDDDGAAIVRYWTSGPQKMTEEGWLFGVRFNFKRNGRARVKIDIAYDLEEEFDDAQTFDLKGLPGDANVEITYRLASPVLCEWFNIRVRFYHLATTAETQLNMFAPWTQATLPVGSQPDRARASSGY